VDYRTAHAQFRAACRAVADDLQERRPLLARGLRALARARVGVAEHLPRGLSPRPRKGTSPAYGGLPELVREVAAELEAEGEPEAAARILARTLEGAQ
jgi:hypothetical protein